MTYFDGPDGALLMGEILGVLHKERGWTFDTEITLESDAEGNYTNRIIVERPSGRFALTLTMIDDKEQ